jgi:mannan endo-1,4-beta-mannosidase
MRAKQMIEKTMLPGIMMLLIGSAVLHAAVPGFYVNGRYLYDPCGTKIILKGMNAMIVYMDRSGTKDFPEIAKTGANCCRIMWMFEYPVPTVAEFDAMLKSCSDNHMIPIVGLWEATGDWSKFQSCVDYWASDTIASLVKKYEKKMIVNIANEPGSSTITDAQFKAYYEPAIAKIRLAGIHTPLMVDADQWGRNENSVITNGPYLLGQDPDHNLIFDWHLYDPTSWTGTQPRIKSAIDRANAANICFIAGEFAFADPGNMSTTVDWRYLTQYASQNDVGWLPWCWKGDTFSVSKDYSYANLTTWGQEVAVTGTYSVKSTAQRTPYLTNWVCTGSSIDPVLPARKRLCGAINQGPARSIDIQGRVLVPELLSGAKRRSVYKHDYGIYFSVD